MRLVPYHHLNLAVVALQGLVHREVGRCGQALDLAVLARLQLEDLEQSIVASAGDVAVVSVPPDALQLGVVGYGDLKNKQRPQFSTTAARKTTFCI